MSSRRRILALVLALVAVAMIAGIGWLLLAPDPTEEVGAVPIVGVTVDPVPTSATRSQQVEALDPLEGTLEPGDPDDPEEFVLGAVELDFGPGGLGADGGADSGLRRGPEDGKVAPGAQCAGRQAGQCDGPAGRPG